MFGKVDTMETYHAPPPWPASPPPSFIYMGRGAPQSTTDNLLAVCGAPSTVTHLGHIVIVLRRSPAPVTSSSPSAHRRADGTLPRPQLNQEYEGRHRAERVLNSKVPYVRCLDRSDREDARLHQPRCAKSSAYGLRGYVDNTLPSCCYVITMILRVRRKFFEITTFPNSGIRAGFYA